MRLLSVSALLFLFCVGTATQAADWPMWRHDVTRSNATPEKLSKELHLQWTRELGSAEPAWANEPRLHFDASFEPIVAGGQMFVASMTDGSVAAFDVENGKENWRFFTDGPVRLAPVFWDGKLYFGSDDGHLYCVAATDGKLQWKVAGAPDDRKQHRHLGNARLVSFWPVRGGPVVSDDGVVYFGAGIWPTMGVFVRAVDAETGSVLWTNANSHALGDVRIDHNYLHEAGLSPQGHLLVSGDMVIVPNGRSMPARLERKTGKLKYFVQGYRNGDSRVAVSGDIALVGDNGVVSLKDGREIANRWVSAGKDAPKSWSTPKRDLFEGPFFQYKFLPGCDFRSVLHNGVAYGMHDGTLYAYDLKNAKTSLYEKKIGEQTVKPARWDVPLLWKLDTAFQGKKLPSVTQIMAGDRLYVQSGNNLLAVQLPADKDSMPKVAWTKTLSAQPTSLVAASGKLFAVTTAGTIHSFGSNQREPITHRLQQPKPPATEPPSQNTATTIVQSTGVSSGYAVVLGLTDGQLVEELLQKTKLHVIAVDANAELVNRLRSRLTIDGPHASRFQAIVDDPATAALPPYLASLLVSEAADEMQIETVAGLQHAYEILRPYGGAACLKLDESKQTAVAQLITDANLSGSRLETNKPFTLIRKTGALPDSADWTHETGDAARSFFSRDGLVQAPLGVLWYGDGRDHGFYKRKDYGHGVKPQVAGGRLFALQIATSRLHAVDAYTGRLLWVRKVGRSARYASFPEAVYVADGRECLKLDPATGEPKSTFKLDVGKPESEPASVSDIRVDGDVIVIALRFNNENGIEKGRWNSELLVALDRAQGQQLWSRPAQYRYNTAAIAIAAGQVYAVDSHSQAEIGQMRRRGKTVDKLPSVVLALDVRTGKETWKRVIEDPPAKLGSLHFMGVRAYDDWLACATDHKLLLTGKANKMYALELATGDQVWQQDIRGSQPLILGEETFVNQAGHTYDIQTGKLLNGSALFRRGGCNYAVGSKNLLFLRSNCAAYVDVKSRKQYNLRNLRSGCSNSLVAADGLLNVPCFSVGCVCNYPIQTSFAMWHLPEAGDWHGEPLKLERPGGDN